MKEKVYEIISETLKIPREKIYPEAKIIDLVADSIQLFELLVRFEREFGYRIRYEEVANIEQVKDIICYAEKIIPSYISIADQPA